MSNETNHSRAINYEIVFRGATLRKGTLRPPVVKIGSLGSSHIVLRDPADPPGSALHGAARMHAVLEHEGSTNTWYLIDLGAASGSRLNGELVDKRAPLTDEGTMDFGEFSVRYNMSDVNLSEPETDIYFERMKTLREELAKLSPATAKELDFLVDRWSSLPDDAQRKYMRMAIEAIRNSRTEHEKFLRRKNAADMALGAEGIEAIYELTPEEAVAKAHETLAEMVMAKQSIEVLHSLGLKMAANDAVKQIENAPGVDIEEETQQLSWFLKGHEHLQERLETILTAGNTLLTVCISRAGGGELSEKRRKILRETYADLKKKTTTE